LVNCRQAKPEQWQGDFCPLVALAVLPLTRVYTGIIEAVGGVKPGVTPGGNVRYSAKTHVYGHNPPGLEQFVVSWA